MNKRMNFTRLVSIIVIGGVSVIFAFEFGPGSRGCSAPFQPSLANAAARVNGNDISLRDFAWAYHQRLQRIQASGHTLSADLAKKIHFPEQVLAQMENSELIDEAAAAHGVTATDDELRDAIHKDPNFQKDGHFDFQLYQTILTRYLHKSPTDYETELRRELTQQKMLALVGDSASVSDDELHAQFERTANEAKVTYVRFLPSMYSAQVPAPSAEDVSAWAKSHEKEIADYYKNNSYLYRQPEQVKARHILIKLDPKASDAEVAAAKAKIEKIRQQIVSRKLTFAQAARTESEDKGSAASGGELGYNERGNWVPKFAAAAFSLKVGELSQPVRTRFGWHLIEVEAKKPARNETLDQVRTKIATTLLRKEKASVIAQKKAEAALEAMKSGKSLEKLFPRPKDEQTNTLGFTTETTPRAKETGSFSQSADIPSLGPAPQLAKAIFAAKAPGALDQVFHVGSAYVVAEVTERSLPNEKDFQKQKPELRKTALEMKRRELQQSFVESLRKKAKILTNTQAVSAVADEG